jgi:arabinose-5-phosphate isomerase
MNSRAPEAVTSGKAVAVDAARALALAREVLTTEAAAITALSTRIGAAFVAAVELILHCQGRVVVCGVGKSGHIGRKLAATLASTGTPAFFVHPTDASHGDLGMITQDDVVIMLSNSGETDELVTLTPHLKREGARLVALDRQRAKLARASGGHSPGRGRRHRGVSAGTRTDREHDGGARARRRAGARAARCARLLDRGFRPLASGGTLWPQIADPGGRHHAHGRRAAGIPAHRDAGRSDRRDEPQGHGHDGRRRRRRHVAGIFTDGDLRRCLDGIRDVAAISVAQLMTRTPRTVRPEQLAVDCVEIMEAAPKVSQLLVVDAQRRLVGALHLHDLFRARIV